MTFVCAESYGENGLIIRTDLLVTYGGEEGVPLSHFAMPKVLVLGPDVVVGVSGRGIQHGLGEVVHYWNETGSAIDLRAALVENGSKHRDYLMAQSDRRMFTLRDGANEWTEETSGFAWIGDAQARAAVLPHDALSQPSAPEAHGMERAIDETWAMVRSQTALRREASSTVGGMPISVYMQRGEFRFTQPEQLTWPSQEAPVLRGFDDVHQVLLSGWPTVPNHIHHEDGYPATLRICLGGNAEATYRPTTDGYAYVRTDQAWVHVGPD